MPLVLRSGIMAEPDASAGRVRRGAPRDRWRVVAVPALVAVELAAISLAYRNNFTFVCRDVAPAVLCGFLSAAVMRGLTVLAALAILLLSRPLALRGLLAGARVWPGWIPVQIAGVLLLFLPWIFAGDGLAGGRVTLAFVLWLAGGGLAGVATLLALAPLGPWRQLAGDLGNFGWLVLTVALFAPEITSLGRAIWWIAPLTEATFQAVTAVLNLTGVAAKSVPDGYILHNGEFAIAVGYQCSGVEGFGLITLFTLAYFYAFAADLRFPNVWLLLPVGLVLSWALNVVRIAALFAIGAGGAPELAINGFHSHAGWLMFTILALSILAVSRRVPWFRAERRVPSQRPALLDDPAAARLLPFALFMLASLLVSTFAEVPGLHYWLKALAMALGLALFLPFLRAQDWIVRPLPVIAGAAIGLIWLATAGGAGEAEAALEARLAALPPALLVLWITVRLAGTVLLVPLVEELFFRGYMLDRMAGAGPQWRLPALALSSAAFAAFHDRWLLAGLAGLAYGLIYLGGHRLAGAVQAHVTSNLVIAAAALISGSWWLI
jgi:hypothetical protein